LAHNQLAVMDADLDRARLLLGVPDVYRYRLLHFALGAELEEQKHCLLYFLAICNSLSGDPVVADEVDVEAGGGAFIRFVAAVDVNHLVGGDQVDDRPDR